MYSTLSKPVRNRRAHPASEQRTSELAHMLVNALGYQQAIEQAQTSKWDDVAETIRFMSSQSLRRF